MSERSIFLSALEIPDLAAREAFLAEACAADPQLRTAVDALLQSHTETESFLETPAVERVTASVLPTIIEHEAASEFAPECDLSFLAHSPTPGSLGRLGHYEVRELLGRGAFGIVLRGFDEKLHRMVAIKVMNPELAATSPPRKRFLREARSSASIRHENIVAIHAVEEQPIPYLVMEYIPGMTLQQRLDQHGPLEATEVLKIGQQIAAGLAAAHAQGLIHRDIKPANILIETGLEDRAKITDFGLARAADDASLTQSGLIAGTPMYMAPEQAKGQPLDHRADLFSLGSVLYTMTSGRPPFRAPNTIAVLKRVCEDTPRPIDEVIPGTPPWLCDIIAKLLAKDPDDRFQSAKEVADVLGQHLAFVREPMKAPRPAKVETRPTAPRATGHPGLQALRAPAQGFLIASYLNWLQTLGFGGLVAFSYLTLDPIHSSVTLLAAGLAFVSLCMTIAGRRMLQGRSWGLCVFACLLTLPIGVMSPLGFVGLIFGVWALLVLLRPDVRAAFRSRPATDEPEFLADDAAAQETQRLERSSWSPAVVLLAIIAGVLAIPVIGLVVALGIPAYQAANARIPALPNETVGRGLRFDGKDDYVKVDGLDWSYPQFTLEAFVTSANDGDNGIIALLRNSGPQAETMFLFDGPASSQIRHSGAGILGQQPFGNALAPLTTGVRQHRALVFDGRTLNYYVNGVWQGKRYNSAKEGMQWNMRELWIGCKSSETEFFRGVIDQVRISRVARYTANFSPITNLQSDDQTLTLYNFDEGSGDVLRDASGHGHQARIFGGTWVHPRSTAAESSTLVDTEWQPLFNGRDLTGWQQNSHWQVEDGALVSRVLQTAAKTPAMLVSERKDFRDFHVRIEAKINNGGDSGLFFRFGEQGDQALQAQLTAAPTGLGSLLHSATTVAPSTATVQPDTWFTLEVIAQGPRVTVVVDDTKVVDWVDLTGELRAGPLALEAGFPGTEVFVRKIEIKAPPAPSAPSPAVAPFDTVQAKAHQDAWAMHLGVPVEYTNSLGMKFRLIPPGEFTMGSTPAEMEAALKDVDPNDQHWKDCIKSEAPQHKVIMTQPIYLGAKEVTQSEYEKVMGKNPSHFARTGMGKDAVAGLETAEYPVESVSWYDAIEFCAKLSQREKLKPLYFRAGETITPLDGTGYRLPSEAEWEFACRAGTTTKYWLGDKDEDLVRAGWFVGNAGGRTHAAGELKANPFGLADIHGNVWEWVQDGWDASWYGQFQEKLAINPGSPFSASALRVLRGGRWGTSASFCRSSMRYARDPSHNDHAIGFRVSLPVEAVIATQRQQALIVAKPNSSPAAADWQPLFNCRDLTGWKTTAELPGKWVVKDGILMGSSQQSYLFSERSDFANFHLRVEAKASELGSSGIHFRAPFALRHGPLARLTQPASGYEVDLFNQPAPIGTILEIVKGAPLRVLCRAASNSGYRAGEWFTLELIADGNRFITKFNGQETVNCQDSAGRYAAGHLALAVWDPRTVVQLRKIEIKELPPSAPASPPGPQPHFFSADEWIDVIPLSDPQLDKWDMRLTGKNEWRIEQGELVVGGADDKPHKLLLPLDADFYPAFECELEVTRRAGEQGFNLNFPTVNGDTPLSFDFPANRGVFVRHRPKGIMSLSETPVLETGVRTILRVEVRRQQVGDRISVWKNDASVGTWTGDRNELASINNEGYEHRRRLSLWVHGGDEFVFHRIRVRMLDGANAETVRPISMAAESKLPPTITNTLGMEFVIVPKGKSWLGGGKDKPGDREVEIPADFYLGKYEVTQDQWQQVMGENPSWFSRTGGGADAVQDITDADLKRFPVETVSWDQCRVFAAKLNELEHGTGWVYRLPTETEWEYACRGGPMTDRTESAFDFYLAKPTNTPLRDQAIIGKDQGLNRTSQVGSHEPNRLGLFDMHRNVWEWCEDAKAAADGNTHRVQRGGSWNVIRWRSAAGNSQAEPPSQRSNSLGLRLARVPSGAPAPAAKLPDPAVIRALRELAAAKSGERDQVRLSHLSGQSSELEVIYAELDLSEARVQLALVEGDAATAIAELRNLVSFREREHKLVAQEVKAGRLVEDDLLRADSSLGDAKSRLAKAIAEAPASAFFTEDDVQRIAALLAPEQVEEVRQALMRLNPKFDGTLTPVIKEGVVVELHVNTDEITNIAPVRALKGLSVLDCRGTYLNHGKLSDLSPLQGMSLTQLDCSSTQVAELSALTGMPLKILHFNHDPVSDLSPLKGMPLSDLGCAETRVADFSPLHGMQLQSLGAQILPVTDLTPLKGLPLKSLDLYHTLGVTDLQPLQGMPLEHLNLQDVPVSDLSALKGMASLRTLHLAGNALSDLTPLQGLKLSSLIMRDMQITDLSPLKGMPLLTLNIEGSGVTDLSPLEGLPLQELRLTPGNITLGLEILRKMASLKNIGTGSADQSWPAAEFWERFDKGEFKALDK